MKTLLNVYLEYKNKWLTGLIFGFAGITVFGGLLTMILWKIHRIDLLFFVRTTMFFNTALCFFIMGIAVILLEKHHSLVPKILSLLVYFFSLLVLAQYMTGIDIHVDQLFAEFYYPIPGTIPGRMSIQTTLNFMLTSASLVVITEHRLSRPRILVSLLLSSLSFILAFIACFGYFFHLANSYGWELPNPIAINTAVLFLFLSMSLILIAAQRSNALNIPVANYVHYIIFLSVMAGTLIMWQAVYLQTHRTLQMVSAFYAREFVHDFKNALNTSVKSLDPYFVRFGHLSPQNFKKAWEEYAKYLMTKENYIDYVGLYSENRKLIAGYAREGKAITSFPIDNFPSGEHVSLSNRITYNNTFGYLIIYQLLSPEKNGFIVRAINIEQFLSLTNTSSYNKDMHITIWQDDKPFYSASKISRSPSTYSTLKTLDYMGKNWKIRVWPTKVFLKDQESSVPLLTLIFGTLIAFFLAFAFRMSFICLTRARRLKKAHAQLLISHEIANLGGWLWDLKNNIITLSPQALRMLGLKPGHKKLPAQKFFHLIHPDETEALERAIASMRSGRSGYSEVYTFVRPDSEERRIRIAAEVSSFEHHYPVEISGIFQDITHLKKLEEELLQSQKLDLVGQLTGGIAHDFNNILTIIQGNLELLSFMIKEDGKLKEKIEKALGACARGAALTKRLLAFARRDTITPEVIKLQTFMENFEHLISPTLGETITCSVEIDDNIASIKVDPHQLESTLLNLLVNARDAMPAGGNLTLRFENITPTQTSVFKSKNIPFGSYVRISVIDTGEGMPPEVLEHVLEPFFTTKPTDKGTGLGLSMVRGFVEQSRGFLRIESTPNEGTTIEIYFPIYKEEDTTHFTDPSIDVEKIKGTHTILVVEDEDEVRTTTSEYLESLGYKILQAGNGEYALTLLKKQKIDLLFTDIVMPGILTGVELAKKAQKLNPKLYVLYTSGYPEKVTGNGHNISPLIIKPYRLLDLAVALKDIFESNGHH